jgi:hypothetical protein
VTLPLPNLDDRRYDDLLAEAQALLSATAPQWTNHHASDPGITIVELLTWLTESVLYRIDRAATGPAMTAAFLRLLGEPDPAPQAPLDERVRRVVAAVRVQDRAVTLADYERLGKAAAPGIARVHAVANRDLRAGSRAGERPGQVSVIVVPDSDEFAPQPSTELRAAVDAHLEERRLLGTRHHVVGPLYAPVSPEVVLVRDPGTSATAVERAAATALRGHLHPLRGGPDGRGWPLGRDVYVSEIFALLEAVAGVDHVPDLWLDSEAPAGVTRCVPAPMRWDDDQAVGLELAEHQLALPLVDPARIISAAAVLLVDVSVNIKAATGIPAEIVRRQIRDAVRRAVHPLHGGPDGTDTATLTSSALRTVVRAQPGVNGSQRVDVDLTARPDRVVREAERTVVRIDAGELVETRVEVVLR